MKSNGMLVLAAVMAAVLGLSGCRGLGYNDQSSYNDMTPGIKEKEYVRTYPDGPAGPPVVTEQKPNAANDPAYPK